jgi:hypothetical protein
MSNQVRYPHQMSIFALPNGLAEWDILKTVLRMATTGIMLLLIKITNISRCILYLW